MNRKSYRMYANVFEKKTKRKLQKFPVEGLSEYKRPESTGSVNDKVIGGELSTRRKKWTSLRSALSMLCRRVLFIQSGCFINRIKYANFYSVSCPCDERWLFAIIIFLLYCCWHSLKKVLKRKNFVLWIAIRHKFRIFYGTIMSVCRLYLMNFFLPCSLKCFNSRNLWFLFCVWCAWNVFGWKIRVIEAWKLFKYRKRLTNCVAWSSMCRQG